MAHTYDAGHVETEKGLPGPFQSGWYPGTWALPATTLSIASLMVFVAVFGFLQIGEVSRALFRLPVPPGCPALTAAAIAWGIALRCRNRPGRRWPRWWALILVLLTTVIALLCVLGGELGRSPQLHALTMASLMSSLTLTPRLLKLHPDRWLVQHVAPLGLAIVLFIALPSSFAFGRHAVEDQKRRVTETIAELSREAGEVREVSSFDWSSSSERRQDALQQIQKLTDLPLEQWVPDRYLWQGAAILGEEERLAGAYRDLLDAAVEGIDPARTPKLWQSQFAWDRDASRWQRDPVFPELSAAVANYHWRSGQILRFLAPPPPRDSAALRNLAAYYSKKEQEVGQHLAMLSKTWAEDWVPALIEARSPDSGAVVSPLVDLLQRPLLGDGSLQPASLESLLDLRLWEARKMAAATHGCGPKLYNEDDFEYFRINCYAYTARLDPEHPGADLRVEMRVVYKSAEELEPLARDDLPAEVFFLFPVPSGAEAAAYREDVMQALGAAVRSEHPEVEIKMIDRSIPSKGFTFESQTGHLLRIVSHPIEDLSGGVPGIQVRAYDFHRSLKSDSKERI